MLSYGREFPQNHLVQPRSPKCMHVLERGTARLCQLSSREISRPQASDSQMKGNRQRCLRQLTHRLLHILFKARQGLQARLTLPCWVVPFLKYLEPRSAVDFQAPPPPPADHRIIQNPASPHHLHQARIAARTRLRNRPRTAHPHTSTASHRAKGKLSRG
jgi:hypothetical protein